MKTKEELVKMAQDLEAAIADSGLVRDPNSEEAHPIYTYINSLILDLEEVKSWILILSTLRRYVKNIGM